MNEDELRGFDRAMDAAEKLVDQINHPVHYNHLPAKCVACGAPIECIQVVEHMGFNLGNATKYIWRAGKKEDAATDLRKAAWYIDREIQKLEEERAR